MALHKYSFCITPLSVEERAKLIEYLEPRVYTGLSWDQNFQNAFFFLDEKEEVSNLNIPAVCNLTRIP